jgi:membrane protein DedA with SNARE-associated domain
VIESLLNYLVLHPPGLWIGPLLGGVAFIETLFPPVPGDILFVALSGWAISGGMSPASCAAFGLAGCFLASCILFLFGAVQGRKLIDGWLSRRVDPDRIRRAGELIASRGALILVFSRFIPGIRSLLVIMAAGSGMRFRSAVLPIAAGAAVWYAVLSGGGSIVGDNIDAVERFMRDFEIWVWASLGLLTAVSLFIRSFRRMRKPTA